MLQTGSKRIVVNMKFGEGVYHPEGKQGDPHPVLINPSPSELSAAHFREKAKITRSGMAPDQEAAESGDIFTLKGVSDGKNEVWGPAASTPHAHLRQKAGKEFRNAHGVDWSGEQVYMGKWDD
jgi:hypothetical protein